MFVKTASVSLLVLFRLLEAFSIVDFWTLLFEFLHIFYTCSSSYKYQQYDQIPDSYSTRLGYIFYIGVHVFWHFNIFRKSSNSQASITIGIGLPESLYFSLLIAIFIPVWFSTSWNMISEFIYGITFLKQTLERLPFMARHRCPSFKSFFWPLVRHES